MSEKTLKIAPYAILIVLAALIVVAIVGFLNGPAWTWLGVVQPTRVEPVDPASLQLLYVRNVPYSKTLWDWLDLLIVPASLAVIGLYLNSRQQIQADQIRELSKKLELRLDESNEQYDTLQEYFDRISDLALHSNLSHADGNQDAHHIARIRTLAVLNRVTDGSRKKLVLVLLRDMGLNTGVPSAISLRNANLVRVECTEMDLSYVNLAGAILKEGKLAGANLHNANLSQSDLSGADLSNADLTGAKLTSANLQKADLTGATLEDTALDGVTYDEDTKWPSVTLPSSAKKVIKETEESK